MTQTAYLSPPGLEDRLEQELRSISARYGRLFLTNAPLQKTHWAQNVWLDPRTISFRSISDAAAQLRPLQKLWSHTPFKNLRRAELIAGQLPYFSPKPLPFPSPLPQSPLGSFTLLDANTLLASPICSSPFANGEVHFQQSPLPPSRAYLKLWEIFLKIGRRPLPREKCLDLGASPGGWSWALDQLGADVIAVDRSPLAPSLSHILFLQKNAFSLLPHHLPKLDWIFCDAACAPQKLFHWLQPWLSENVHLVCTLKFQQATDADILSSFSAIPNSQLLHLFHNKHELTFLRLRS